MIEIGDLPIKMVMSLVICYIAIEAMAREMIEILDLPIFIHQRW